MILSFKKQFEIKILTKIKRHTIRADVHDRWREKKFIHFVTGARTKNYNQFESGMCISTQIIDFVGSKIFIDGRILAADEIESLAINDGFDSVDEFRAWFSRDFHGKIIHWTHLQY